MSGPNSILNLLFNADTTGLNKAQEELKKTQEATKNLTKEQVNFLDQIKKTTSGLADFSKETDKVGGALKSAVASFNPVTMAVSALTAGIAALSFGALKDMVMSVVSARAEIGHLSAQTGISVEALSGLKNIALLTGTSMDEVAQLTTKFNQAVTASDRPMSLQHDAFENLGIKLKDSNGHFKDTLTLQVEAAKALNKHSDGIEKDAYYMAIWGKNALQNKEYLKELGEQQEIQGKLTTEQSRKAIELERDMRQLSKASNEFKVMLADEVVPWLAETTKGMVNLLKVTGSLKGALYNVDLLGDSPDELKKKLKEEEETLAARKNRVPMAFGDGDPEKFKQGIKQLEDRITAIRKLIQTENDYSAANANRARKDFAATDPRMGLIGTHLDDGSTLKGLKDRETPRGRDKEPPTLEKEILAQKQKLEALQGVSEEQQIINKFADAYYTKYPPKQVEELRNIELQEVALKQKKEVDDAVFNTAKKKFELEDKMAQAQANALRNLRQETDLHRIEVEVMKKYGATQADVTIAQNEYNIARAEELLTMKEAEGFREGEEQQLRNEIELLKAKGEQLKKVKVIDDEEKARQSTFGYGWSQSFEKYKEDATNAAKTAQQVFGTASKAMEDSIVNFAKTGKFSFKEFASSVIEDLIRIEARKMTAGILGTIGGFLGLANGGAFDGGKKLFASGDVFNRPTDFTYSGGVGQLGEAGPEGVLPLRRNSAGQLGVMSSGGGGTTQVNNITVNVQGGKDPQQTGDIVAAAVVERISRGVAKQEIARASRVGGMLNPI